MLPKEEWGRMELCCAHPEPESWLGPGRNSIGSLGVQETRKE